MNLFTFVQNGKTFQVAGPAGASETEAKAIFDTQSSTGALIGMKAGQSLNLASQIARGLQGVSPSVAAQAAALTTGTKVPDLKGVVPSTKITTADLAKQGGATMTVANLSKTQVQALLAQAAAEVNQDYDKVTLEKGIGRFGFNADQLEKVGYLKPGTAALVKANPANFVAIVSSPTQWTGKDNMNNIAAFLAAPKLQSKIEEDLMTQAASQLKNLGVLTDTASETQAASLISVAVKYGVDNAVKWSKRA